MAVKSYRKEYLTRIWSRYFGNIEQPDVVSDINQTVTLTKENKTYFTFMCTFVGLQERAIKVNDISEGVSILILENVFLNGPGTISVRYSPGNVVIDKFCSFESRTEDNDNGHFANFYGNNINGTILRGSISNGGNGNKNGMISHDRDYPSLSNANISNCFTGYAPAFKYFDITSASKVSFCNFENLYAKYYTITMFSKSEGIIENCNYINNSQNSQTMGLVYIHTKSLKLLYCVFKNNTDRNIFSADSNGKLYIYHCNVDNYSETIQADGVIDTQSMSTEPFHNDLKFYELGPCEGYHKIFHYPQTHPITPVVPSNRRR